MAVLGLRLCARAFSSCGKRGPLFIAVRRPPTIAASLAAEHRLQTRRLSNHGSRAKPLRSMWDPPRPGLEPVSPALAGRLSTTAPPGKPLIIFKFLFWFLLWPTGCSVGCLISTYLWNFQASCSWFLVLYHYGQKRCLILISVFLNLLRLVLCPNIWSILKNLPCVLEKSLYSAAFGWNVLHVCYIHLV